MKWPERVTLLLILGVLGIGVFGLVTKIVTSEYEGPVFERKPLRRHLDPGPKPSFFKSPSGNLFYDERKNLVDDINRQIPNVPSMNPEGAAQALHLLLAVWFVAKIARTILRFALIRRWFSPMCLLSTRNRHAD